MSNALQQNLDYTDKDFASILERLKNAIPTIFPTWTDFNDADFGVLLIELFSFIGDVLTKYQDNQSRESRIATATQRKNLISLAKLVNYTPRGATAAQYEQTLSISAAVAGDVLIPRGTIVKTVNVSGAIRLQTLADVTISAGSTEAVTTIEHSETRVDEFTSDGTPNQSFILSSTPYLDDSAVVIAGDGAYSEVSDFLSSLPTSKHYTVTVDQLDRATITFGNGTNGKVPSGSVEITYKIGGGTSGNVEQGKISRVEGSFSDSFGTTVSLSTTNAAGPSVLGTNRASIEEIRLLAPASLRVLERAVAREDYEIVANSVPGVARSLHLTSNEDSVQENTGILYIIPTGGGLPSQALKDEVAAQFAKDGPYPSHGTFALLVQDPDYLTVNVAVTVFKSSGYSAATVAANIRAELEEFFALTTTDEDTGEEVKNEAVDFGFAFKDANGNPAGEISWSSVFNVVNDTPGVRKIQPNTFTLNSEEDDLEIENRQFPQLGTVSIVDGDTGAVI